MIYQWKGNLINVSDIKIAEGTLDSIKIDNTLRGYIHLNKVVVGMDDNPITSDLTEFTYDVVMENEKPVFKGDSIPWYGINSLFYHDEDSNYYQAQIRNGQLQLYTETGGPYAAYCAAGFDPNLITEQEITYIDTDDNNREKTVVIFGNRMTPSEGTAEDGYKKVTARLKINQKQTLNIANVPVETTFNITEVNRPGYNLVGIVSNVEDAAVNGASISGEIMPNSDNNITYTNKRVVSDISIQKTDENGEGLSGAVFQLLIKEDGEYRTVKNTDGIGGLESITIDEETYVGAFRTNGNPKSLTDLPDGEYRLDEVFVPDGYTNVVGKIYFKIENGVITSTTANEFNEVELDTTTGTISLLKIANIWGVELPEAGGTGPWVYAVPGSILLLGAGILLVKKIRNR